MIISFSGLDGTGKSTHADMTREFLSARGVRCGYRHLIKDSMSYFFTHKVLGRFSSKAKEGVEKGIRSKNKGIRFILLSSVKKLLLVAEILYFNLRFGALKGSVRKTVVCDRYFYDALVQAEYLGFAGGAFSYIYRSLIIEPDVAFFLYASPETAYSRKEEFDMEYFNRKNALYDEMNKEVSFNTVVSDRIDSTQGRIESCMDMYMGGGNA